MYDLDTKLNSNVQTDITKPVIHDALLLMEQNYSDKNSRDQRDRQIFDFIEEGYDLFTPVGGKKVTSKMIGQAIWNMQIRGKPLDFTMHGSGADYDEERVMTEGLATILKKGGYLSSFRDKGGLLQTLLTLGDSYRLIGAREEGSFPIQFTNISNGNIYVNTQATDFRCTNKPVTKCAVVFSGTWNEFCSYFPDAAKTAGAGTIPRQLSTIQDNDQTSTQQQENKIEWCYYYDIENRHYAVFAGSQCTLIEEKDGKEFPFIYKDQEGREQAYIPVSHYKCFPSVRGFNNRGIAEMFYDLAKQQSTLYNLLSGSVENNLFDPTLVSLPHAEAEKFFGKLQASYKERALGKRPLIPIEYDATNANQIGVHSLSVPTAVNEYLALTAEIEKNLKNMGIFMGELELSTNPNQLEIMTKKEISNQCMRQIMEGNASETEFELDITLDFARKMIKKGDKTGLNLTTLGHIDGKPYRADFMTLGLFKTFLGQRQWFFNVDSKSGKIPSGAEQLTGAQSMLPYLAPGTPDYNATVKQIADVNGIKLSPNFAVAMPEPGTPNGGQTPQPNSAQPSQPGQTLQPLDPSKIPNPIS